MDGLHNNQSNKGEDNELDEDEDDLDEGEEGDDNVGRTTHNNQISTTINLIHNNQSNQDDTQQSIKSEGEDKTAIHNNHSNQIYEGEEGD